MTVSTIRDKLFNAPRRPTAQACIGILNVLQDFSEDDKGTQIAAIGATFLLLAERFGVSPADIFTAATNLMNDHDKRSNEFAAVAAYLKHEVA